MKVTKFYVNVREVHIQPVRVEADTKYEAVDKVKNGEVCDSAYDNGLLEYSHTLDTSTWTVDEVME